MVERGKGTVELRSHYVAEQVVDALEAAEESVQNAVSAAANAAEAAERETLDAATDELIAYCQASGNHVDERDAQVRLRLGRLDGRSWKEIVRELLRHWKAAGRDPSRLKTAEVRYTKDGTGYVHKSAKPAWDVSFSVG